MKKNIILFELIYWISIIILGLLYVSLTERGLLSPVGLLILVSFPGAILATSILGIVALVNRGEYFYQYFFKLGLNHQYVISLLIAPLPFFYGVSAIVPLGHGYEYLYFGCVLLPILVHISGVAGKNKLIFKKFFQYSLIFVLIVNFILLLFQVTDRIQDNIRDKNEIKKCKQRYGADAGCEPIYRAI